MKGEIFLCAILVSFVAVHSIDVNSSVKTIANIEQQSSKVENVDTPNFVPSPTEENVVTEKIALLQSDVEKKTTQKTTTTTTTTTTPETTTKIPDTTTSTTTSAPNTTTTAPDTTTITPAPITTPAPTPIPKPSIGRWNYDCIMLQMAAQIKFQYNTKDSKNATSILNIPVNATVTGDCSSNVSQTLILKWGPDNKNILTAIFKDNGTQYYIFSIRLDVLINGTDVNEQDFMLIAYPGLKAPMHMSYHCTRKQIFNLTESGGIKANVIGEFSASDVQFEAYHIGNNTKFSTARDCDSTDTPDLVPFAVGIALVALIVIVLISYLFARRRSTARGYMSF